MEGREDKGRESHGGPEVARKKVDDRAKKLALLRVEKERKAAEAAKAKELEAEKERQRLKDLELVAQKPKMPEPADDEDVEGTDGDEEDLKAKAWKNLVKKRRKVKGKEKVVSDAVGVKRKVKSKEYVAESEEESAGPSERPKKRTRVGPSPSKGIEYKGKGE